MSDIATLYLLCGIVGVLLGLCHLHAQSVYKHLDRSLKSHIELSTELYKLRADTLTLMATSWKEYYHRFMNNTYLEFLDCAYHSRYGTKNGWAFRLPPTAEAKESIDLRYYFTDEEVEDIRKARAIYGDDKRLEHMDKRLGL